MVILIANNRGGSGKTATALNMSFEFARRRKKVLLCDFDSQSNLTIGLGLFDSLGSVYNVIIGESSFNKSVVKINKYLDFLPNVIDAGILEIDIKERNKANLSILKNEFSKYNYVLIDTPASFSYWMSSAIEIADWALIPVITDTHSIKGLVNIEMYFSHLNPKLGDNYKIFINKSDNRTVLARHIEEEFTNNYFKRLLKTKIRRNIAISESYHRGICVRDHAPKSNGAKDYAKLAKEVINILQHISI